MNISKTIGAKALQLSLAGLLVSISTPGFAASTWALDTGCVDNASIGNTLTCGQAGSGSGVTVTAQAWSTAAGVTLAGTTFDNAAARNWGATYGLGVVNKYEDPNSPVHTADNQYGTDVLLLTFSQAVDISNVKIGWWQTDSDISVLAYKGPLANNTTIQQTIQGKTLAVGGSGIVSSSTASGWQLVQQIADAASAGGSGAAVTNTIYSSWWLVSAYNGGYGGASYTLDNDFVKILSVSGDVQPGGQTPEPGSFALMGLALAGMVALRKKNRTS